MSGNIFLVGLMGSGKTTVGRALARKLNKRFIDSDHESPTAHREAETAKAHRG